MKKEKIEYYIVTTSDAHNSEYVRKHDMLLEYLTGFTGSNGTLLVTPTQALLWTDGRYFIQCERELEGSGIRMMRIDDPRDASIEKYLGEHVKDTESIGFDGRCITKHMADRYVSGCAHKPTIKCDKDIAGRIWDMSGDRPADHYGRIRLHDMKYAGESVKDKLKRVREAMRASGCCHLYLSKPDDIMWLYNLRGEDITYNPIALSYAFVSDNESYIFAHTDCFDEGVSSSLKDNGVSVREYGELEAFLREYEYTGDVMLDIREVSVLAYDLIADRLKDGLKIVNHINPTTELKAIKNETEIRNMKEYFLRDSLAMTKYLKRVKAIMSSSEGDDFDELKAGRLCDEIRLKTDECFDLSFTTIAAYGSNAAMMHYEASEDSYMGVDRHGILLTDCGGQYPGATTDVTRTIAVGPVTEDEKKHFTLVLKGWLALMHAVWLEGCTGRNLDILARQYLWNEGIDYKCGTGHGVGYCLGVHEGPQRIGWRYVPDSSEAVLKAGMTVTNEPGVYIEGKYGIRTENTMLVVEKCSVDGDRYLCFENLTWVPIDEELVDYTLLDDKEKAWLRDYQEEVAARLKSLYDSEEE